MTATLATLCAAQRLASCRTKPQAARRRGWGLVLLALASLISACQSPAPPQAGPDPIYKTIPNPLLHFQVERLRWLDAALPKALSDAHGTAKMYCDLSRLTIDQMIDVAPLDATAAPLAASLYKHCAIALPNLMLDGLLAALAAPTEPAASPCLTTIAPVMTYIGDNPSNDPEIKRKRDLALAACPDFAAQFKAFEDTLKSPPPPPP